MIIDAVKDRPFSIGWQGENGARTVRFSVGGILAEFPAATFTLLNRRHGDEEAYPVPDTHYSVSGDALLWVVMSGDTATAGESQVQLVARNGNAVVKTEVYYTYVEASLGMDEDVPEPWQGWVDEVTEAAESAEQSAADAQEAKEAAQDAQEFLENASAVAETLEPGSSATASVAQGVFTFGIPQGLTGNGIAWALLNADYTLTLTFTDGSTYTTPSIRGAVGVTPNLTVGTVSTGAPGSSVVITITGTAENPVLNLTIPRGDKGETGATPAFSIGTVSTGLPGSSASASITGTAAAPVLNLTIPRGDKGEQGDPGLESVLVGTLITGSQYRLAIERVSN